MKLNHRTKMVLSFSLASAILLANQNCSPGFTSKAVNSVSDSTGFGSTGSTPVVQPPVMQPPVVSPSNPTRFSCDPNQITKSSMLRLTNREYKNTINAILNTFSAGLKSDSQLVTLLNNIESDILIEDKHFNREQYFLLTSTKVSNYFEVAFRAGALVAADATGLQNYANTSQCLAATTITQACHKSFIAQFAKKAFHKTLSAADAQTLANNLWDSTLSKTDLITLTVASILEMPDFIYRVYDSGTASARGANVLSMTAQEYASKISYLITGAPPDATLSALVDSGDILNPTTASAQIDRLLLTTGAQDMVKRLFRESLGYDMFDNFQYSSDFLAGLNTTGLKSAMIQEMDDYFKNIVISQNGTYKDLMTSRSSVLSSQSLADIYGVSYTAGQVTLPANRAGFLNRAAFLSQKSGSITSPVKRGLSVIQGVLCGTVPPAPPTAPTVIDPLPVGVFLTTRERYEQKTQVPGTSCNACHSRMNNVGYLFENFDSIGRARAQERIFDSATGKQVAALNVDTSAVTSELKNVEERYADSVALMNEIFVNDKAVMCFAQKFSQFESRKIASASDGCKMNSLLNVILDQAGNLGSIQQAMKAYMLSDDFKIWSY